MRHTAWAMVIMVFRPESLAIHVAAWRGFPAVVQLLIEAGSPVDVPDKPRAHAACTGCKGLRGFLLDGKAFARFGKGLTCSRRGCKTNNITNRL